ncbi:Rtf2 RING-finger-domain-containing protein [Podospora conica]|nr:Rtf2 RING-finger-domain-containing protein [Schizothecium conicum]
MGNDGGSIPKRRELVKSAARAPTVSELKATAHESLTHAWTFDPLTSLPLDLDNAVSDAHGRLYNYESVLHALLLPSSSSDAPTGDLPFSSTGIKSLRDVVRLKFKRSASEDAKVECPVSLKELGPSTRAVYLVPCGHVFAEAARRHMEEEGVCPECSEGFEGRDVIPILPTEKADVERLAARLEELRGRGLTHGLKKDKSGGKKKRKAEGEDGGEEKGKKRAEGDAGESKAAVSSRGGGGTINNSMTASVTAKVMAEQEENNKRRKLAAQR